MHKHLKKPICLSLICLLSTGYLISCGETPTSSDQLSSTSVESSSSTPSASFEEPDRSKYPYLSSLSAYKKTDWKAKWIWIDESASDTYVGFRKQFTLDEKPEEAMCYFSADTKIFLYVNGQLAIMDGPVKRGASEVDSYYQAKDLSEFLVKGKNTIAVLVDYFGKRGNASVDSGHGGFLFEMKCGDTEIHTDSSWKATRRKEYENRKSLRNNYPNHEQNNFLAEYNVYYNAQKNDGDFTLESYDDSSWENATIVAQAGKAPFGELYSALVPTIAFDKDYTDMLNTEKYLNKAFTTDTKVEVDLPENMQFTPYIELEAEAGKVLTFYTDTYCTQALCSFMDDYKTIKGVQSYEQLSWRSGTKFIIEVPSGVTLKKLAYRRSGYDSKTVGSFTSDVEGLSTLWTKAINTLHICIRDSFMDCPERERSPYCGDSANQMEQVVYALDDNGIAMIKKTIRSLPGWIKTDNIIPIRWPSSTPTECPMQALSFMISCYEYYLYTKDTESLELVYPIFINYLKVWELNQDGTVPFRSSTFPWVDWGTGYDTDVMENCWYYWACKTTTALGEALGKVKDADITSRMEKVFNGFSKFKTTNGYTSLEDKTYDDRGNALAVLSGLASKEDYPAITNILKTEKRSSPYMEKFVLQALCEMGETEAAQERMLDRYSGMISSSYSTLWEMWKSDSRAGTINHGWTGGPLTIMEKYFAGIKPTKAGYEEYQIEPYESAKTMNTSVTTPKGNLTLDIKRETGKTTVTVNAPVDEKGVLKVPCSWGETITANGAAITTNTVGERNLISLKAGVNTVVIV